MGYETESSLLVGEVLKFVLNLYTFALFSLLMVSRMVWKKEKYHGFSLLMVSRMVWKKEKYHGIASKNS